MKNSILIIFLLFISSWAQAQTSKVETILIDGNSRRYTLVFPTSYDGTKAYPLVLNLHGYYQFVSTYRGRTQMDSVAQADSFIVAYPRGEVVNLNFNPLPNLMPSQGLGWNVGGIASNSYDDEKFLINLTEKLINKYNVDTTRIFMMGYSLGAQMTMRMADAMSNRIRAVACLKSYDTLPPVSPVPTLVMRGSHDPYFDTTGWNGAIKPWNDVLGDWLNMNSCSGTFTSTMLPNPHTYTSSIPDSSHFEVIRYMDCDTLMGDFVIYLEHNGGHWLPRQDSSACMGMGLCDTLGRYINQDISTAVEVWNFFKSQKPIPVCKFDLTISEDANILTANQDSSTYQWIDCATGMPIDGEIKRSFEATENGDYAVIVGSGYCADTSDCVNLIGVGLGSIVSDAGLLRIYPNPSKGEINIQSDKMINQIRILDMTGKIVLTWTGKQQSLTELQLPQNSQKGIYIIQILTEEGIHNERFILN